MVTTIRESKQRTLTQYSRSVRSVGGSNPGTTVTESSGPDTHLPSYFREKITRVWFRTANYRQLVQSGAKLPDNQLYYEKRVIDAEPQVTHVVRSNSFDGSDPVTQVSTSVYGLPGLIGFGQNLGASPDLNALSSQILDKAKGHQFNAPVFLAEGRKTIDMVVNTATHLTMLARALKRGDITWFLDNLHISQRKRGRYRGREVIRFNKDFGRDAVKTASNKWLEAKYGWVPFLGDVKGAVEAYFDAMDRPINQIGQVRAHNKVSRESTIPQLQIEGSPNVFCKLKTVEEATGRMLWRFSANQLDLPARFGLLNPFEIAWELTPFSFVGDWLFPIGSYFSALDAPLRFKHEGGVKGSKVTRTATYSDTWCTTPNTTVSGGHANNVIITVERNALDGIPMPSLSNMRFEPRLGGDRVFTAVALLNQQLLRFGKR